MPGELVFIGMGLSRGDLTLKAMDALKKCDSIFCEMYTSILSNYSIEDVEKLIGKKIEILNRRDIEEGDILLKEASQKRVAFLVVGDPMAATTHVSLRIDAEKRGIKTKVINGLSVLTVVPSILGLQHYKFGRTTTLPYPESSYFPLSPYHVIKENLERGLHTLVLLDIDREKERFMTIKEGIEILFQMEEKARDGIIKEDMLICGVARAGSEDCEARIAPAKILKGIDFGEPPHTIVIPGNLHFIEKEALEIFSRHKNCDKFLRRCTSP